ncbi:MAG: acc operon protein [Salinirussus sp.]
MSSDATLVERLAGLDSAGSDEAAAVAAAIGAHLRDQELAAAVAAADDEDIGWTGRHWQYSGRLDRRRGASVRVNDAVPVDPWTAAGRADRL